jgi:hypothetical protein
MKKMKTIILVMVLTLAMGLPAYAETGAVGNPGGTNPAPGMTNNTGTGAGVTGTGAGVTGTTVPGAGVNNNMYRTAAADNDANWEWIGLLGLVGLAGLMGRNRERNPQK